MCEGDAFPCIGAQGLGNYASFVIATPGFLDTWDTSGHTLKAFGSMSWERLGRVVGKGPLLEGGVLLWPRRSLTWTYTVSPTLQLPPGCTEGWETHSGQAEPYLLESTMIQARVYPRVGASDTLFSILCRYGVSFQVCFRLVPAPALEAGQISSAPLGFSAGSQLCSVVTLQEAAECSEMGLCRMLGAERGLGQHACRSMKQN